VEGVCGGVVWGGGGWGVGGGGGGGGVGGGWYILKLKYIVEVHNCCPNHFVLPCSQAPPPTLASH